MKSILIIADIVLLASTVCCAETYDITLAEECGNYVFSESKQFHIDLETDFEAIHEARFKCEGTIVTEGRPGVFYAYLGEKSQGEVYHYAMGTVISNNGPEQFTCDVLFKKIPYSFDTWNFLLDGEADGLIRLFITGGYFPGQKFNITGTIDSASIVINASPVPEPAGSLITGVCICCLIIRSGLRP